MARARTKKIDNFIWTLSSGIFSAISAGTTALQFAAAGSSPVTVMRMRGQVLSVINGVSAANLGVLLTMGVIKVPRGSATTVQYDPFTDPSAPWLWYTAVPLIYDEYVTDVVASTQAAMNRNIVDNKAMRRIREDEDIFFVAEGSDVVGGPVWNINASLRMLTAS